MESVPSTSPLVFFLLLSSFLLLICFFFLLFLSYWFPKFDFEFAVNNCTVFPISCSNRALQEEHTRLLNDFKDSERLVAKLYKVGSKPEMHVHVHSYMYGIRAVWMQEIEKQKQQIEALSTRDSNETYISLSRCQ